MSTEGGDAVTMKWQDPPGPDKYPAHYGATFSEEAALLRDNPGRWALLRAYGKDQWGSARRMAADVRSGRLTSFRPPGEFEGKSRTELNRETGVTVVNVYARYTGAGADGES